MLDDMSALGSRRLCLLDALSHSDRHVRTGLVAVCGLIAVRSVVLRLRYCNTVDARQQHARTWYEEKTHKKRKHGKYTR